MARPPPADEISAFLDSLERVVDLYPPEESPLFVNNDDFRLDDLGSASDWLANADLGETAASGISASGQASRPTPEIPQVQSQRERPQTEKEDLKDAKRKKALAKATEKYKDKKKSEDLDCNHVAKVT
ncbi:hypothetical protein EK21DRAFT_107712 [Setomelanomma holmii]|uniref:Uncharacterized protein n=1 Tax=Setomelanomma holmii TaxID=210430 RepID=A0A9P4LP39_9PLEO|nr:hypothetical protein EK21DRAFT_107712 [Setomelanomma holmii]